MFQLTPTVRTLLILNVLFLFLTSQFETQVYALGALHPIGSEYFRPWQFLTYMFLHSGFGHLFSNMLVLLLFGATLEQMWGERRFLIFWIVCGVGAGVLYQGVRYYELRQMNQDRIAFLEEPTAVGFANFYRDYVPEYEASAVSMATMLQRDPNNANLIANAKMAVDSTYDSVFNGPRNGMVGASGAVFGLLMALAYLLPNRTMVIFPVPIPIKIWIYVFLLTAYELYQGIHPVPGDNVAHFAHLGGMLIGFIVLKIWQRNGTHYG